MLQQNAIAPATLELLKKNCAVNDLESFRLGGGTSLALRMGRRLSIDLISLPTLISTPVLSFKLSQKDSLQRNYYLNKIKQ